MRNIYILSLFLVFTACNQKQQNSNINNILFNKNDSILITYECGEVQTNVAIRCEKLAAKQARHLKNVYLQIIPEELLDAYSKDSSVLEGMKLEILPPALIDTFIVDSAVINKIIKLLDNRVKTEDYDEDARMYVTIKKVGRSNDYLCFDHFPYQYKYNGQSCSIDKEALFLLRYYSGYYSWFDERDLDQFEELKDTVYYQKVMEQVKLCEERFKWLKVKN